MNVPFENLSQAFFQHHTPEIYNEYFQNPENFKNRIPPNYLV